MNIGDTERRASDLKTPTFKRVRNAVILPDGSKPEPMGSGLITGLLGVGGMANVYQIWNSQLEVSRAVKLLHPNYTDEAKQRFETEIKITAKLHHANIIEIHAVGQWNGLPLIEMELIDGVTLEKMVEDRGALPVEVCTAVGIMMGRALRYAHNQEYVIYGTTYHGVIHRDLKPSNIMVNQKGVVKLMDFGIARPTDASIHTTDGSILGTMQYLSPEQLEGKGADIRTDIYSLGAILYEMLTGVKAFPENNVSKLMLSKIKNDFKPLDQFEMRIHPKLRKIIHRSMMHDREKRLPNAATLLSELVKIHKQLTSSSPEQVLRDFMNTGIGEKITIRLRKTIPVIPILITALSTLALYSVWKFLPVKSNQSSPQSISATPSTTQKSEIAMPATSGQVLLSSTRISTDKPEDLDLNENKKAVKEPSASVFAPKTRKTVLRTENIIEQFSREFDISDPGEIFLKLVHSQRWSDAEKVMPLIPSEFIATPKFTVLKLRMLRGLGRSTEWRNLLLSKDIRDAEFFLLKGQLHYRDKDLSKARYYLEASAQTPALFMDGADLRRERLYYAALCNTQEYTLKPDATTMKSAMDSWYDLKVELRTTQDHHYFKEAVLQMDRIAALTNKRESNAKISDISN